MRLLGRLPRKIHLFINGLVYLGSYVNLSINNLFHLPRDSRSASMQHACLRVKRGLAAISDDFLASILTAP